MARNTISTFRTECKDLLDETKSDKRKLVSCASTIDSVLKDYCSLITNAYRADVIGAMRNLHEVERKINKYQLCVQAALQAPDGNFTAQLQQVTAEGDLDTNDEEDLCPEMRQLQTIVNRPRVSGELTGRTKSTARGQKGTEDTEMVDVDESNLDPLSRAPIKTAVRNRRCRHLYCYTTIVPYIRSITYPRCPIAGCHLPHIREDDLEFTNTN